MSAMTTWLPWVPELPVEVQDTHTRIDFMYGNNRGFYLLFECKRSNPAVSNWCFARTLFTSPHRLFSAAYAESIVDIGQGVLRSNIQEVSQSDKLYQIALDVKSHARGDSDSKGRGQIEDAATQVCRHLNGFVEFYHRHSTLMQKQRPEGKRRIVLVPVILTTARLWTTEFDLSTSNPETGRIDIENFTVREVPWLWYQYHQSPGLKHSSPTNYQHSGEIEDILFYEFVRPIAIVTPQGLEEFMCSAMWNA